ncbi:MAG: hypothetical protein Q9211_004468 [Gyalolechia sp. 1 TL-2023]
MSTPPASTSAPSASMSTPLQVAATTETVDQANATEQQGYNSDDGVTQVSSPTASELVRGAHLLEKMDDVDPYPSDHSIPDEQENSINERMVQYMARNTERVS